MKIESLKLVYFSPTGTTKRIIEGIARGIEHEFVEHIDITKPEGRERRIETAGDELLVVGAPVYFGRVQIDAVEWLKTMKGHSTPTVCVVVYGNREYDDALLELKDTMPSVGCIPIACGAYIGEHSFSSAETPIAVGRPDAADISHAQSFGEKVRQALLSVSSADQLDDVSVPGQHPYIEMEDRRKDLSDLDLVSVDSTCVQCGACAQLCPVGAIDLQNSASVDKSKCVLCHACTKHCPTNARKVKNDTVIAIAARLSGALQDRKAPRLFF